MTRLENDPRLTAYVLNELDPSEQADVEALLAADPVARHAAEQIRAAADRLSASLAAEPALMLDDPRRARLAEGAGALDVRNANKTPLPRSPAVARGTTRVFRPWVTGITAAAAAIVLVATGFLNLRGSTNVAGSHSISSGDNTEQFPLSAFDTGVEVASRPEPALHRKSVWMLGIRDGVSAGGGQFVSPSSGETAEGLYSTTVGLPQLKAAGKGPANRQATVPWSADVLMASRARVAESGQGAAPDSAGWDRFSFSRDPNLSYGYQLPYGKTNSNQRFDVREVLRADAGPYYVREKFAELGYVGGVESTNSVVLKLDNLSAGESQKILAALSRRAADQYPETGVAQIDARTILVSGTPEDAERVSVLLEQLWPAGTVAEPVIRLDDLNGGLSAESYSPVYHNPFLPASANPLSTFSIDVDTASYANIRRYLLSGQLPPPYAVRIEECLNYFPYNYPPPAADADAPFSANMEVAACPWAPQHRLVRIGLRGWEPSEEQRPAANLVFLIDVSGSMQPANKLPLVVESLKLLLGRLRDDDRVALAVYAGASGLALPSTPAREQAAIEAALDNLSAGGSTNGGEGINLAYAIAAENFVQGGINRVILCTDGDFNVGVANRDDLQKLIEEKAKTGVFLSVFGFGMGNLKDATLETLADRGNGNYAYIDSIEEARKVLVEQMGGTLQTIAKDVKIQVEFNPAAVAGYRLLGYENRMLAARDFNDDTKDAGEIGAGHTVTALYEIVPAGGALPEIPQPYSADVPQPPSAAVSAPRAAAWSSDVLAETLNDVVPPPPTPIDLAAETPEMLAPDPEIDPLKYQTPAQLVAAASGEQHELLTLKLRYKAPEGEQSRRIEFALDDASGAFDEASPEFRFAAAVAGFAMKLRGTPFADGWTLDAIAETALTSLGDDPDRYRTEFLTLVKQAELLQAEGR